MTDPARANGKICYLILPSRNAEASASFYRDVFGWHIRGGDNGEYSFDDTTGMVSGMWDTSLQPRSGGYEIDIMVDDIELTTKKLVAAGGRLAGELQTFGRGERYQKFIDLDGNELGMYQSGKN